MIHQTLSELTRNAYISLKDSVSSYSMTVLARGELERSIHEKFLNGDLTAYISQSVNGSFSFESMAFQGNEVTGKPVIPGSLSVLSADAYTEYISQSLIATFTSLPMACPANKEPEKMKIHRTDDGVTSKEVETHNTHTPQDTKTDSLENPLTIFDPNLIKIQCIVEGEFEIFSSASMTFQGNEVTGKPVIPGSLSELSADAYIEYISQSLIATFTSIPMACPANKEPERMKIH